MSVETQAIFAGHVSPERVLSLLKKEVAGKVALRDMHRPDYKVMEFERLDGTWSALHLFLDSSMAQDYADAYQGSSTFMTAEYSPQNYDLVHSITAALGGVVRKTSGEPWVALQAARPLLAG